MFTSVDKAIVALIMSGVFLINTFTGFHFGVDEGTVSVVVAGAMPILTWLAPNKGAA